MIFFLFLATLTIFFSIFYLLKFSKNKRFFFFFALIFLLVYRFIVSKEIKTFSYNFELEKQIKELIKNPDSFANIEPKKIIFFLENKLK